MVALNRKRLWTRFSLFGIWVTLSALPESGFGAAQRSETTTERIAMVENLLIDKRG